MNTFKIVILLSVASFVSGCSTTLENVRVKGDFNDFKTGFAKDSPITDTNIIELVPKNENINNWTKLITIQSFGKLENPIQYMNALKEDMQKSCKNTKWSILESKKSSVLYEWGIDKCKPHDTQQEIAILIQGIDRLHRVAYTEKTKVIDDKTRNEWIKSLSEAYLMKGKAKIELP